MDKPEKQPEPPVFNTIVGADWKKSLDNAKTVGNALSRQIMAARLAHTSKQRAVELGELGLKGVDCRASHQPKKQAKWRYNSEGQTELK